MALSDEVYEAEEAFETLSRDIGPLPVETTRSGTARAPAASRPTRSSSCAGGDAPG